MADAGGRAARLGDRIKVIVAKALERGLKDPRLGFVTITDVRVTRDLQHASIFYTVLGTDEERNDTAAALRSATGHIRSEVGRNITARLTPTIEFVLDAIPENAAHIEGLLAQARERDAESRRTAESATFAGEADPYRHDEDDEGEAGAEVRGAGARGAEVGARGAEVGGAGVRGAEVGGAEAGVRGAVVGGAGPRGAEVGGVGVRGADDADGPGDSAGAGDEADAGGGDEALTSTEAEDRRA